MIGSLDSFCMEPPRSGSSYPSRFIPSFEEFSNYLLNFELGIETAINSHLNLRLVAQDKYNNVPAVGKEKNDLTFLAGVSYKF